MVASATWGENVRQVLLARGAVFFGDVLAELRQRLKQVPFEAVSALAAACSEHLLQRHARLPLEKQHPAALRASLVNEHLWYALERPGDGAALHQIARDRTALESDPDVDIDAVASVLYATTCFCDRRPGSAYWSASRFVDSAFARAAIPLAERPSYSFQRHGLAPAQLAVLRSNERAADATFTDFAEEAADMEVQDALRLLERATRALGDRDGVRQRLRALFSIG